MTAVYGPTSPEQIPGANQQQLRDRYLIEDLFVPGSVRTVVTHYDRVVAVGAVPTDAPLALEAVPEIRSEQFLDHREIGIVNIGAAGAVHADGERHVMATGACLYLGRGVKDVVFESDDAGDPRPLLRLLGARAHHLPDGTRRTRAGHRPRARATR